jgi:hypothetical protein
MALPVSFYSRTLADNTITNGHPQTTTSEVAITTLTAGNVAAQDTLASAYAAGVAGITLGVGAKSSLIFNRVEGSPAASSNPLAKREKKYLVRYHDTTSNQKFQVSYGTADDSLLTNNSEFLDLGGTEAAAFVSAFEAFVKSPADPTHAVVVDSIQFVGRNT